MRRLKTFLLIGALLAASATAGYSQSIVGKSFAVTSDNGLNLRTKPMGTILYKLKKDDVVQAIEEVQEANAFNDGAKDGYWIKVRYGDIVGYVFNGYLQETGVSSDSSAYLSGSALDFFNRPFRGLPAVNPGTGIDMSVIESIKRMYAPLGTSSRQGPQGGENWITLDLGSFSVTYIEADNPAVMSITVTGKDAKLADNVSIGSSETTIRGVFGAPTSTAENQLIYANSDGSQRLRLIFSGSKLSEIDIDALLTD